MEKYYKKSETRRHLPYNKSNRRREQPPHQESRRLEKRVPYVPAIDFNIELPKVDWEIPTLPDNEILIDQPVAVETKEPAIEDAPKRKDRAVKPVTPKTQPTQQKKTPTPRPFGKKTEPVPQTNQAPKPRQLKSRPVQKPQQSKRRTNSPSQQRPSQRQKKASGMNPGVIIGGIMLAVVILSLVPGEFRIFAIFVLFFFGSRIWQSLNS